MMHIYETTREWLGENDAVIGSAELRIHYTYRPATADHYDPSIGGPGGWTPGDADEVEIIKVEWECYGKDKPRWQRIEGKDPTGADLHEEYAEWAYMEYVDDMAAKAQAELEDMNNTEDPDRAYDEHRDRMLEGR